MSSRILGRTGPMYRSVPPDLVTPWSIGLVTVRPLARTSRASGETEKASAQWCLDKPAELR